MKKRGFLAAILLVFLLEAAVVAEIGRAHV